MPRPMRPRTRPVTKSLEVQQDFRRLPSNTAVNESQAVVGKTVIIERKLIGVTLAQDRLHEFPHVDSVNATSIRPEVKNEIGTSSSLVPFYWIPIVGISLGLVILAIIITVVVIVMARRGAVKASSDVEGGKLGFPYGEAKTEYKVKIKVRFLWNKLEEVIKFSVFSQREGI